MLENATFACLENEEHVVALHQPYSVTTAANRASIRPSDATAAAGPTKLASTAPQQQPTDAGHDSSKPTEGGSISFLQWLVTQITQTSDLASREAAHISMTVDSTAAASESLASALMDGSSPVGGLLQRCLQSAVAVLMNVTHNNQPGCHAVAAAKGLQAAVDLLHCILDPNLQLIMPAAASGDAGVASATGLSAGTELLLSEAALHASAA